MPKFRLNGKEYQYNDCPYCGGRLKWYIPWKETGRVSFKCVCGAEAHGSTLEEALAQWNEGHIHHDLFPLPKNRIEQDDILIYYLKEKNKRDEAYYQEQLRKREIALDNLRTGRPENADGGFSDYLKEQQLNLRFKGRCYK